MSAIQQILNQTQHRPWPLPSGKWQYYQEWNNALFFHWEVPFEKLRKLVPEFLTLDSFEGKYYISLVAFSMQQIRPRNLPAVKFLSDFHEINVRTYIDMDNKKGVYFLNIEAEKALSVWVARKLSGLPYEKASIRFDPGRYHSVNNTKGFRLNTRFSISETIADKTALDLWLTERYCLYLDRRGDFFRFDIHHPEWKLKHVKLEQAETNYQLGDINLRAADTLLAHYSKGVSVLSWKKTTLSRSETHEFSDAFLSDNIQNQ